MNPLAALAAADAIVASSGQAWKRTAARSRRRLLLSARLRRAVRHRAPIATVRDVARS